MQKTKLLGLAIASLALAAVTPGQAQPYSNAVVGLNPVAYWPLNETAQPPQPMNITATNMGTAGGADGYYGAWYQPSGASWFLTNNIQRAPAVTAPFDGSTAMLCQRAPGQYVVVPRNTNGVANPSVTLEPPFTIEAWLQIGTVGSALGTIVSEGGFVNLNTGGPNPADPYYGGLRSGWAGVTLGQYQDYLFLICQSTNGVNNKNNELDTSGYNQAKGFHVGDWVHVVATFDGTTEAIWTNGVLSVSKNIAPNGAGLRYIPDPTTPLMIGSGSDVSASYGIAFQGAIHDVAIYTNVLASESIGNHYQAAFGTNLTFGSSYTNAVLADSPALYFRLNDAVSASSVGYPSGTFPVANNYGLLGGAAAGVYQPGTTPGVAGPSYSGFGANSAAVALNGFLGSVDVGGGVLPSELNPTGIAPLTVVSWFKGGPADAPGRFQEILGHGDLSYRFALGQTAGENHFNPGPGPELQFASAADVATNGWALNDGNWHMVAGVSDGTNDFMYLDGLLVKSGTYGTNINIVGSTNDLLLGGDSQYTTPSVSVPNTIRTFDGSIAQVAFWTNALSSAQIAQLYGAAGVPASIAVEPLSQTNNSGANVSLSVIARGSPPFSYQWYKNGSVITGATSSSLAFTPATTNNNGGYFVVVGNGFGNSVTSTVTTLTIFGAPVIADQTPANIHIFAGTSPTLRVLATGPQPISYQWSLNGSPLSGATSSAYTIANVQSSGNYSCSVTNFVGPTSINPISLTVVTRPAASYPLAVLADNPLSYFRLDEASGTIAFDYVGGLNAIYSNAVLGQPGYSANDPTETSTYFGSTTVDSFAGDCPSLLSFSAPSGSNVEFSIEAWVNSDGQQPTTDAGIVTIGYGNGGEEFALDCGAIVNGNRTFRFYVNDATGANHGVTCTNGSALQDGQWHHVVAVCDEAGGSVSLYVDGVLNHTASIGHSGIRSFTSPLAIGSRLSASTATDYDDQFIGNIDDVAVYNTALSAAQVQAHYFSTGVAPAITSNPTNTTVNVGDNAFFYATATGSAPLTYLWYDLSTGNLVPGQTNSTLVISNVTAADSGRDFQLTVTNSYGQATSVDAMLSVLSGPPSITTDIQPLFAMGYAGTPFTYSVSASGTTPFTYTWTRNGTPIAGATRSSYSFTSLVGTNLYAVTLQNSQGSAPSSTATNIAFAVPILNASDYTYKMKITFSGYNKTETLVDFPALVQIGTNIPGFSASQLAVDGGDLRFTDASGTREIPHEIDEWNPNGVSSVWVQVPSLSGNTNFIWAYWGNPAATTPESWSTNGGVWVPAFASAPAYDVVYHLKEGSLPFADSTTAHPATNGVAPAQAAGIVGTGGLFNGSSWLDAGTNDVGSAFTLFAWVNIDSSPSQIETIWANQHGGYGAPGFALWVNTYNNNDQILDLATGNGTGGGNETRTGAGAVSYNQWHLIEASVNLTNGASSFYLDGVDILDGNAVVKDLTSLADLNLGRFTDGNFNMHGMMDEARVRLAVSDAAWVWADYMTVAQNSTFETYSPLVSSAVTITATRSGNNLILTWSQGTLQSASTVNGQYTDISTATSPWTVPLSGAQQFYRVKVR